MYNINSLVLCLKLKVVSIAAGLFVVEAVKPFVGFLQLLGSVVEWGGGVVGGGHGDRHLRGEDGAVHALDALGFDLKYFAHFISVYVYDTKPLSLNTFSIPIPPK